MESMQCKYKDTSSLLAVEMAGFHPASKITVVPKLLDLPSEMLLLIIEYLAYPDALALKNTHPRLKILTGPTLTVGRRVEWLIDRADLKLSVPRWGQLNLRTDQGFTSNAEVQTMLRDRRRHEDCRILARRHLRTLDNGTLSVDQVTLLISSNTTVQCTIDPNVRGCTGICRARKDALMLSEQYDNALSSDQHDPSHVSHRRYTCLDRRHVEACFTYMIAFVASFGFCLFSINKIRLRLMFKLWMLLELILIGAVVVHTFFGIEYKDMLEHGHLLQRQVASFVPESMFPWSKDIRLSIKTVLEGQSA